PHMIPVFEESADHLGGGIATRSVTNDRSNLGIQPIAYWMVWAVARHRDRDRWCDLPFRHKPRSCNPPAQGTCAQERRDGCRMESRRKADCNIGALFSTRHDLEPGNGRHDAGI